MSTIVQKGTAKDKDYTGRGFDFVDAVRKKSGLLEDRLRGNDSIPLDSGVVAVKQGTLTVVEGNGKTPSQVEQEEEESTKKSDAKPT